MRVLYHRYDCRLWLNWLGLEDPQIPFLHLYLPPYASALLCRYFHPASILLVNPFFPESRVEHGQGWPKTDNQLTCTPNGLGLSKPRRSRCLCAVRGRKLNHLSTSPRFSVIDTLVRSPSFPTSTALLSSLPARPYFRW